MLSSQAATFETGRVDPQHAVPEELKKLPQWVAWWSVRGEGKQVTLPGGTSQFLKQQPKPHKLPIRPDTGNLASVTRRQTWSSFDAAAAAASRYSLTGVGFVFTDSDPYSGVDLDNCRNSDTGEIADWAWKIINSLDSYTEVSPSGTGVHVIVRGSLPQGKGNQAVYCGGKVEMFSRARYFTVTGVRLSETPVDIGDRSAELSALHEQLFSKAIKEPSANMVVALSDIEVIAKARQAKNGTKFDRLWSGAWEGDYSSQSEADCALCGLLAFWVGRDPGRIDSLFRQSGLMRLDKWGRESYRDRTINKALEHSSQTYHEIARTQLPHCAVHRQVIPHVVEGQSNPDLLCRPVTPMKTPATPLLPKISSLSEIPSVFQLESKLDWRVEEMIAQGSITMICAESGTGKTWLGYYIAGCVANCIPVLGHSVTGCKVLYLDGENPLYVAKQRLKDLGFSDSPNLTMWGGWNAAPPPGPNDPLVIEFAREHKGLIVYDSLIEFHSGSEQSSTETRAFMRHFRHLANFGASVVVLHHSGKAETSKLYRGSSDIKAAVDTAYALTRTGKELAELGDLALTCFKGRLAPGRNFSMKFKKGKGFLQTAGGERKRDVTEVVTEILIDAPGANQSQIVEYARKLGVAKAQIEACLRSGDWTKKAGPHNSTLYSLGTKKADTYASAE